MCICNSDFMFICYFVVVCFIFYDTSVILGERYDFVINADQPVGAYWVQVRGLGECGIRRVQQLAILRYARGPYQPTSISPTYDVGLPQGVVSKHFFSITHFHHIAPHIIFFIDIFFYSIHKFI